MGRRRGAWCGWAATVLALAVWLGGGLSGAEEVGGNQVVNGDFEGGAARWWGKGMKTGGVVEENPAGGSYCLKLVGDFACQDKIPVTGGKRYRVSMKIRSQDAPEKTVYVQVSFRGEAVEGGWYGPETAEVGKRKEKVLFATGGTHEWKEFSRVIEAPPTADQALLYLRKQGDGGAGYFDDIHMVPTDELATTAADLRGDALAKEWLPAPLPASDAQALVEAAVAEGAKPAPDKLVLAENGKAKYHVHVGTKPNVVVLNAAHDLAEYLGKISGGDFMPLSYDAHPVAGPLLVVGRDNELTRRLCPDIPYDELGKDGFVIRTVGPHVVIAGNTPGGTMYGVNWFLDHKLGVKWLSPDYTHIPSNKTIELAAVQEKQTPRFTFRQILSAEGEGKPWGARILLNGNSHGAYGRLASPEIDHFDGSWQRPGATFAFQDLFSKEEKQSASQWFSGGQYAMMNPEARKDAADAVVKRLKGIPNYGDVWFGIMNNDMGWDADGQSRAFAKEHGGTLAAPRLDMMVAVGEEVRKTLPDAKLAFNAYRWSFDPPSGMTVPDYLLVFPMTIQVDYSTALHKGRNEALGKGIAGWNDIAKNILVWDHITNFHGFLQPTPNIYPICESLQWLAGLKNVFGYFAEGSWNTPSAEFASLRAWIMARLLWDPSLDYKAAIAEYCDLYYGPAGKLVKEYIDLAHEASAKSGAPIYEKTQVDSKMFDLDFVTKADELFRKAEAAVASADPAYQAHVRQARMPVDYIILMRRHDWQKEAAAKGVAFTPDTAKRIDRIMKGVEENKMKAYRQGGLMTMLPEILAIERRDAPLPKIVADLPPSDWMIIEDFGVNRYSPKAQLVADEAASDGGAARLKGGVKAWFLQLEQGKLPEDGGLWDVYAEVRADAESASDRDVALCVGAAPPLGRFTKVTWEQLKDGKYHLIKAPGGPFRWNPDEDHTFYVRGESPNVEAIYVDRFVLVRAKEKEEKLAAESTQQP